MTTPTPLPPRDVSLEDMRMWIIQKLDNRGDGKGGLPTSGHWLYSILYELHEARNLLDRFLEVIPYGNQVKKDRRILRVDVQTWISKNDTNKAQTDYYMLPQYFSFEELQEEIRQYQERQDETLVAEMGLPRSLTDSMGVSADHQAGIPIVPEVKSPMLRRNPADQSPPQPYLQTGIATVATDRSPNPARQRSLELPLPAQQSITAVTRRDLPQSHSRRSRSSRRLQNLAPESVSSHGGNQSSNDHNMDGNRGAERPPIIREDSGYQGYPSENSATALPSQERKAHLESDVDSGNDTDMTQMN